LSLFNVSITGGVWGLYFHSSWAHLFRRLQAATALKLWHVTFLKTAETEKFSNRRKPSTRQMHWYVTKFLLCKFAVPSNPVLWNNISTKSASYSIARIFAVELACNGTSHKMPSISAGLSTLTCATVCSLQTLIHTNTHDTAIPVKSVVLASANPLLQVLCSQHEHLSSVTVFIHTKQNGGTGQEN
jgi:hypothetical protein